MNTTRATTEAARVPTAIERYDTNPPDCECGAPNGGHTDDCPACPADDHLLTTAGYSLTSMGGNIEAWRLTFGAGELLITEDDDGTWTVMLYGDQHSEPLNDLSGVTLADAIEAGEVFRLRASGNNA